MRIGAVTAASAVKELAAGTLLALAVSSPARLPGLFAHTPTWTERSVDCVVGAWRGITAPRGIDAAQIAFWQQVLATAVTSSAWQAELTRHCWTDSYLDGTALHEYLERERDEMALVLGALRLLR